MKLKEITALGITEELAGKIMEMYEAEAADSSAKLAEAENRAAAAEKNAAELSEKVKAFDGVDVEALRKTAADWESKYKADIAAAKIDSAVELALTKAGAKDIGLAKHLIDSSLLKLDGDKVMGLSEQLERATKEKAFLFGGADPDSLPRVTTGLEHRTPAGNSFSDADIRAVMGLPAGESK